MSVFLDPASLAAINSWFPWSQMQCCLLGFFWSRMQQCHYRRRPSLHIHPGCPLIGQPCEQANEGSIVLCCEEGTPHTCTPDGDWPGGTRYRRGHGWALPLYLCALGHSEQSAQGLASLASLRRRERGLSVRVFSVRACCDPCVCPGRRSTQTMPISCNSPAQAAGHRPELRRRPNACRIAGSERGG